MSKTAKELGRLLLRYELTFKAFHPNVYSAKNREAAVRRQSPPRLGQYSERHPVLRRKNIQ